MYVKYFKLKKSWIEILDLDKNIKERDMPSVYKICNKRLNSYRGKIEEYNIKLNDYKNNLNEKNLGILKKELRKNKLKDCFVINSLENDDAILVVRGSIYSIDTSIVNVLSLKDWLKSYEFSKEIKYNESIKKYKNISEVIEYDSLSRYGIQKALSTCGIVSNNNKIYIKYDGFSYNSIWENISDRNIILKKGEFYINRLPKHKLLKWRRNKEKQKDIVGIEEGSIRTCLETKDEYLDGAPLPVEINYGKPVLNINGMVSSGVTAPFDIISKKKMWVGVENLDIPELDNKVLTIFDMFKRVPSESISNKLDRKFVYGDEPIEPILGPLDMDSILSWKLSELKLSLLEFSYSGPWNIYKRKYSVENKYKWGKKGKRKLFWKKKSHTFSDVRSYDRKLLRSRECIDNVIWGEWKKKRYKSEFLNELRRDLLNNNDVKEYYVNGEIKDVDLRRILKKDKEKKPRWKSLFHLHKRWWIEIRDPLLNIHCLIDLGLFLGNKILEYKISGKFNKCRYWRELCKEELDSVGKNIFLSKIVYVIRKLLNIEYNLIGILELENILLTAICNGEFNNLSRKSILYNIIHKLINKEETSIVCNKYEVYDNKRFKLEFELNKNLKDKIRASSNRRLILKIRGIREYVNITTGDELDYGLFSTDRLSYLRKFYNINCNNKLLETIITNYKNNNLVRLPSNKPRIYPVRKNQWVRYPWRFHGKIELLRKTLLRIVLENYNDSRLFDLIIDLVINKSELRLNERDRLLCYLFSKTPHMLWKNWISVISDKKMVEEVVKMYACPLDS